MIAYHILCHDNFEQVSALLNALYTPYHTFLIDIDNGKSPNLKAMAEWRDLANVHIHCDALIGWGGCGTLRKTLAGAFKLLELNSHWRYYVVLSGQDLPLKPRSEIEERLRIADDDESNFIAAHAIDANTGTDEVPARHQNSAEKFNKGHTLVHTDRSTIRHHANMHNRRCVDVQEIAGWQAQAHVYVRNADPFLLAYRDDFFNRYPFYTGANWFTLHRSLVQHMLSDQFTYELYHAIRHTFFPDESFFQCYVMNTRFRETVIADHQRLILRPGKVPDVKIFDMNDWETISQSKALFGRKFDMRKEPDITAKVLATI